MFLDNPPDPYEDMSYEEYDYLPDPPGEETPIWEPIEIGEPPETSDIEDYLFTLNILSHVAEVYIAEIRTILIYLN